MRWFLSCDYQKSRAILLGEPVTFLKDGTPIGALSQMKVWAITIGQTKRTMAEINTLAGIDGRAIKGCKWLNTARDIVRKRPAHTVFRVCSPAETDKFIKGSLCFSQTGSLEKVLEWHPSSWEAKVIEMRSEVKVINGIARITVPEKREFRELMRKFGGVADFEGDKHIWMRRTELPDRTYSWKDFLSFIEENLTLKRSKSEVRRLNVF